MIRPVAAMLSKSSSILSRRLIGCLTRLSASGGKFPAWRKSSSYANRSAPACMDRKFSPFWLGELLSVELLRTKPQAAFI
jgi:hypothetical protein